MRPQILSENQNLSLESTLKEAILLFDSIKISAYSARICFLLSFKIFILQILVCLSAKL